MRNFMPIEMRKLVSWIYNLKNKNVIIHSDMDGLLCMAFLQHHAQLGQIVGLYDLETLYFTDPKFKLINNFKELIAIDLDMSLLGIKNIGHHMTCVKGGSNSLNINEFYKLDEDLYGNFFRKYPLNTVILLYSLFNIEPKSLEEIALIVYADSVFSNYINYSKNVTIWLKKLKQFKILNALENDFDKIMDIIDTKIKPITDLVKDNRVSKQDTYSQCHLTTSYYFNGEVRKKYKGNPVELLSLIKEITNWNIIDLPSNLFCKVTYNNVKVSLIEEKDKSIEDYSLKRNIINKNIQKLDKFLEENKQSVLSSSMTYRDGFKVTINKLNADIALINGQYQFIKKENLCF